MNSPLGQGLPNESPPPKDENDRFVNNPGFFEDLHRKVKEIFPQNLDGCKLIINKALSNHFQVNHTFALGQANPSNYSFGATYVGTKQYGVGEAYPVILGDINGKGSLNAQIIHHFTRAIRGKLIVQTQGPKYAVVQTDLDYKGPTYTASVTSANIDLLAGSGMLIGHFLKRFSENICLGSELFVQRAAGQQVLAMSLVGRYTNGPWEATANLSPAACQLSYFHRTNDRMAVGVELETSLRTQESNVQLGYQIDIPAAQSSFKGIRFHFRHVLYG